MTEVDPRIIQINQRATEAINAARTDPDISAEKRDRLIAVIWLKQSKDVAAIQKIDTDAQNSRRDALAKKLYGLTSTADALSFRDALSRVQAIDGDNHDAAIREALSLLEQARVTGDDILTRAVLKTAFDRRLADVVNKYTVDHPSNAADAEALWDIGFATKLSQTIANGFQFLVPKPRELQSYNDWAIEAMAVNA